MRPVYFPQVTRTEIKPSRKIDGFDPDQHFLASYNLKKLTPGGPEPHGISGAACHRVTVWPDVGL
jgi:hypothetical protein